MGARIQGEGSQEIVVEGVEELVPAKHEVIPDRIELATSLTAAGITGGHLRLTHCPPDHVDAIVEKLRIAGLRKESVTQGQTHASVAETAFHIMMCLAKRVHETQRSVRDGAMGKVLCVELAEKTLRLVGVGKIGKALATMAKGFGMRVIGVRKRAVADDAAAAGIEKIIPSSGSTRRSRCPTS